MTVQLSEYDSQRQEVSLRFDRTGQACKFFFGGVRVLDISVSDLHQPLQSAGQISNISSTDNFVELFTTFNIGPTERNLIRAFALINCRLHFADASFQDGLVDIGEISRTIDEGFFNKSFFDWDTSAGAQPAMYLLSKERLQIDRKNITELYQLGMLGRISITVESIADSFENYFVPLDPPEINAFRSLSVFFPWVRILNEMGSELEKLNQGGQT